MKIIFVEEKLPSKEGEQKFLRIELERSDILIKIREGGKQGYELKGGLAENYRKAGDAEGERHENYRGCPALAGSKA